MYCFTAFCIYLLGNFSTSISSVPEFCCVCKQGFHIHTTCIYLFLTCSNVHHTSLGNGVGIFPSDPETRQIDRQIDRQMSEFMNCLTKLLTFGLRYNETRHPQSNSESSLKESQEIQLISFICSVFYTCLSSSFLFILTSPSALSFTLSPLGF